MGGKKKNFRWFAVRTCPDGPALAVPDYPKHDFSSNFAHFGSRNDFLHSSIMILHVLCCSGEAQKHVKQAKQKHIISHIFEILVASNTNKSQANVP